MSGNEKDTLFLFQNYLARQKIASGIEVILANDPSLKLYSYSLKRYVHKAYNVRDLQPMVRKKDGNGFVLHDYKQRDEFFGNLE